MKKLALVAALLGLLASGLVSAQAEEKQIPFGVTPNGFTSDNVDYVKHIPFEIGTATGMNVFDKYMVITSWKNWSIYDISDPLNPTLISITPIGFQFENENVATNGKIMLFSESLPNDALHIWDLEDLTQPSEIATLAGAGNHTTSCLFNCMYGWGSEGTVTNLKDPFDPKIIGDWTKDLPGKNAHDVTEIAPGLVFTSTQPVMLLDARKSRIRPKVLAVGDNKEFAHSVDWPRGGKDRFALVGGELNAQTRCDDDPKGEKSANFKIMDTKGWQKTGKIKTVGIFEYHNGIFIDGAPPVNGLGCSPHWFEVHPTWKDGGLVAVGSYEHGTQFLTVNSKGTPKLVGFFVPLGGSTSASYWRTRDIVYNVDYARGIDILRYRGPLRATD